MENKFRKIPQINDILTFFKNKNSQYPEGLIKYLSLKVVEKYRNNLKKDPDFDFETISIYEDINRELENDNIYSFEETINATGVVLHTNLGRAPLSKRAIERVTNIAASYSNLEFELSTGTRGSRYNHVVEIIKKLTGAEDAIIVNNNAAAVFLMLNTLAKDKNCIVSRGELVEIGDSFRVSSIMEASGAKIIEVGATNRTHLYDYENNIDEETKVLMKVHTSNFKVVGFHEEVSAPELKTLIGNKDIYIIEDLGSGSLIDLSKYGLSYERTVSHCIKDGIDLVSFSCDKLLGGPQGGIICGKSELIKKIKKNQLLRAFRVGKLTISALEATLYDYLDEKNALEEIPTLKMISMPIEKLEEKANILFEKIKNEINSIKAKVEDSSSLVGGGAYPTETLNSKAISIINPKGAKDLEEFLRLSKYHIIANVYDDKVHLDLRTIREEEYDMIVEILKEYYSQ